MVYAYLKRALVQAGRAARRAAQGAEVRQRGQGEGGEAVEVHHGVRQAGTAASQRCGQPRAPGHGAGWRQGQHHERRQPVHHVSTAGLDGKATRP